MFEWNEAKAASNVRKHGLSFGEAIAVFADPASADFDVSRADDREVRRKAIGMIEDRLVSVVYTHRGSARRLISARPANPSEMKRYADR